MARPRRVNCRVCGKHVDECGALSKTGKCYDCGTGESIRNAFGLANHDPEYLLRWRRGMAKSVGATLPEDIDDANR